MALNFIVARGAVAAEMHALQDLAARTTSATSLGAGRGAHAAATHVRLQAANVATPIFSVRLVINIPSARRLSAQISRCPNRARIQKRGRSSGVLLAISVVEVHVWQRMEFAATTKTMTGFHVLKTTFAAAMSARQRKVSAARTQGIQTLRGFR